MKTEIHLVEREDENIWSVSVLPVTDDPVIAAKIKKEVIDLVTRLTAQKAAWPTSLHLGRPSKKLVIVSVEDHDERPSDGEGGIKPGDTFSSSRDLSLTLGYHFSAVNNALSAARRKGKTSATLRGVTFEYVS